MRSGGILSPVNAGILKIGTVALLAGFSPQLPASHSPESTGEPAQAPPPMRPISTPRKLQQDAFASAITQPSLRKAALLHSARKLIKAKPFFYHGRDVDRSNAVDCLAAAAWYEAGKAPEGQRAVIQIVINRLSHPSFPKSICGVVFQGSERETGCQFTFTCDGSLKRRFPSPAAWQKARRRAESALNGGVDESVGKATHYHASYVQPWWSGKLKRLTTVGEHVFYRWPGRRSAFENSPHLSSESDFDTLVSESKARDADPAGLPNDAQLTASLPESEAAPSLGDLPARLPVANQTIFLGADRYGASGRWAIAALNACVDRKDCLVLVYGDASSAERNRHLTTQFRERPLFLFIRDKASAMNIALWDCDRVTRPDPSQCLPASGPKLKLLMRERNVTPLRDRSLISSSG